MGAKTPKLPSVNTGYDKPHLVIKGNPAIDGPYLDDIREAQAAAYRKSRQGVAAVSESEVSSEEEEEVVSEEETGTEQEELDLKLKVEVKK